MKRLNDIGSLLEKFDPLLTSKFESRHTPSTSLKMLNREYQGIRDPDKRKKRAGNIFVLMMLIAPLCSFACMVLRKPWYSYGMVIISYMVICIVALVLTEKAIKRDEIILLRDEIPLGAFVRLTEKLNPQGDVLWEYREEFIEAVLVNLAAEILRAEENFDKIRSRDDRFVDHIMNSGQQLQRSEKRLKEALEAAQEFGLEFNRSGLFTEAKKKLHAYD